MAKAKNKVMHRLNQMLEQYRELHRLEKNEQDKETLRALVEKHIELIEWASESFSSTNKNIQSE